MTKFRQFIWLENGNYLTAHIKLDNTVLIPVGYQMMYYEGVRTGYTEDGQPIYESFWRVEGVCTSSSKEECMQLCFEHHCNQLKRFIENE